MQSELFGREHELAVLEENLTAAVAGQPRLVLCRGEPGIGKTRLAQELCTAASDKHVTALWGRADDSAGAPPYWPWRQMLRGMSTIADT
ncbi:MAG: ATP-binding protein, partial [Geodermatophilaceae bacterium]